MDVFSTRGVRRVMSLFVLGIALCLFMLVAVVSAKADPVCADGRMTLEAVIGQALGIEASGKVGRMVNVLDKAPGGAAVLYVVFEKASAGAVFVFQDECLVMFSETLAGDKLLQIMGKGSRSDAFGGKGI